MIAALIYVAFALLGGGSSGWVMLELAGVVVYGAFAWLGIAKWPRAIALGWLLHVLWDVTLHPRGHPGFVPSWYPPLCLGFDVYVGVALWVRFRTTRRAAR